VDHAREQAAWSEALPIRTLATAAVPAVATRLVVAGDADGTPRFASQPTVVEFDGSRTGAAASLTAGALASCVAGAWSERVDAALAETDGATLSKAARLSRRLHRQAAREPVPRVGRRRRGRSVS